MISAKMKNMVNSNSTIRAMFEEGKLMSKEFGAENVYDFSLGNPNVEPPQAVKEAIMQVLSEDSPNLIHGYMSNSGYEDVRDSIAAHLNKKYNSKFNLNQIVMTCGAAGGLNIILKTLINPGDEAIVFCPYFGEYANYVSNFEGVLIESMCDLTTFLPNMNHLESVISPKTKAIILNTPNNPTGTVYNKDILQSIAEIIEKKEKEYNTTIYVISDEPYREIVYDGVIVEFMPNYFKNCFIVYSYSKSLSLPGERIGYIAASLVEDSETIMSALNISNRILGFVNAPSLFQRVIVKTLDAKVDCNIYLQNRDILYNHLVSLGFDCIKPKGAFYLFPKCLSYSGYSAYSGDNEDKFIEAAKKQHLLLVGGKAFHCQGYFRAAYCVSKEKLENSLEAFTRLSMMFK